MTHKTTLRSLSLAMVLAFVGLNAAACRDTSDAGAGSTETAPGATGDTDTTESATEGIDTESGGSTTAVPVDSSPEALENRAYVISEESDDLFVVDLRDMSQVAKVDIGTGSGTNANHMAILSKGGTKLYVSATHHNDIVVFDTVKMETVRRIKVGGHPTHASACIDCAPFGRDELWVVNEEGGSISVIDMATDEIVETIMDSSMVVPHFTRFSDGFAYVPSIGGNQITVIDLNTRKVSDVLLVGGATEPGACSADPCGFADAQIDGNGVLVAAHIETGKVVVYDTKTRTRLADIDGGDRPWAVFVDQLSNDFDTHLMPNWGDSSVSILDRVKLSEVARSSHGDQESYGVNYSPLAPNEAFVLNRIKEQVAVINRSTGELIESLDVGGTTETATTTADGKYLLLPLSSTNEFLVLDIVTRAEVARFPDVGVYPWSVTTVGGQNYCH